MLFSLIRTVLFLQGYIFNHPLHTLLEVFLSATFIFCKQKIFLVVKFALTEGHKRITKF